MNNNLDEFGGEWTVGEDGGVLLNGEEIAVFKHQVLAVMFVKLMQSHSRSLKRIKSTTNA